MKKIHLNLGAVPTFLVVSLIALSLLFISGCSGSNDQENPNMKIVSLFCENQENPNAVELPNPCLSWKMSSGEKGQSQTAYRILVASSSKLLSERKADVWDSKKIRSSASLVVPFGGKNLVSGQKYYWTVMVWDKAGKPTGYANPACWEMALLEESLWQAKWISAPRVFDYGRHEEIIHSIPKDSGIPSDTLPLFRNDFTIDKPI